MNEAALLETTIKMYADDPRSRIEKQYYKRKRGKAAKPIGEYSLNVSLQEIRDQQEEFIAETYAKEEKSSIRSTRSILLQEIEQLKSEWQLPPQVRDSIRAANHAAKPLNAVDWSALPRSDDSVTFQLRQPLGNEGRDEEEREEEEEEEILDFINIVQQDEEEMPSSPPCLPDYK
ncbi:hypothetical protein FOQG_19291 [Fusarium oxysporum f. sp. raphani 54005]|uniref:Uncharacterized protein n=1 Tax=Fusarium oxysporum f. sp. raphani 54005 TaxID=1089458 RepID=X0B1E7_FUSOX|nr:hypothetical protein FOQG_19291 [Fusarium oxysporum f. sp. raphani 54005]